MRSLEITTVRMEMVVGMLAAEARLTADEVDAQVAVVHVLRILQWDESLSLAKRLRFRFLF